MANFSPQRLVHVTGMPTISAVLQGLPKEIRTKILAKAVEAGSVPLVEAAKRNARRSVRTGALYMSIGSRVKKYEYEATAVAVVGPRKGYFRGRQALGAKDDRRGAESPSHYAHLIEYGHHVVTGGSSRPQYELALTDTGKTTASGKAIKRWKRAGVKTAAKGQRTSFVKPRPFMRPAFVQSKAAVARALLEGLGTGIEQTRAKLIREGAHAA